MPSEPSRANVEAFSSPSAVEEYTVRAAGELFVQERKAIERYFDGSGRVLDVGCGSGRVTHNLSAMGYDAVGLDPSGAMLDVATDAHLGLPFALGEGTALPFRDAAFEYALFAHHGLDYVHPEASRRRALREIRRVLEPGGLFVFSSHNTWNALASTPFEGVGAVRPLLERERPLDPRDRYAPVEVRVGETLVYFSSPAKQRRQLRQCGFELLAVVGKREGPLRYLEYAPHYVARRTDGEA